MQGTWNAVIKTPFVQLYALFLIHVEQSGSVQLTLSTEPMDLGLSFGNIQVEGNLLQASATGVDGVKQQLELAFEESSFSGKLTNPYLGILSFAGTRGKGTSFEERLQRFGKKSVEENRYWKGKWIWDCEQPQRNEKGGHHLVYFRRTFNVAEGIKPTLKVDITADSRYRLYINGNSVSVGPCKGDQHEHYYETVDVSEWLVPGKNVLAAMVMRYPASEPFQIGEGGPLSVWRTQSAGLLVEASLRDENGIELEALHSGPDWRAYRHQGYRHLAKPLIQWIGGVEEVDGTGAPFNWELAECNDTDWQPAVVFAETRGFAGVLSPWNLVPRHIPQMYETDRSFVSMNNIAGIEAAEAEKLLDGSSTANAQIEVPAGQLIQLELDAGELTTGYLMVGFRAGKGSTIRILSAECYDASDSSENHMGRKKANREDCSGKLIGEYDVYKAAGYANGESREEKYEPFWFRTFRYVRLEIEAGDAPLVLEYVKYRETGYPLDVKAAFQSSDQELNKIWELSIRTLRRCMHETYEDCPYYEQLQYAMDSRLMMLYTYRISADDRMPRRTIGDFHRSRQPSGLLQSRYPSVQPQVIPSFALYWIDMLAEHYEYYGDLELLVSYRPALLELLDWFNDRLTPDGIVGVTSNRFWTYFDWVADWPLGAPPESVDRPMFLLSFMYADSLRKAARMIRLTGWNDAANDLEKRADQVGLAVKQMAWSEERQLFRDLPDTEIYSQHMQIMAVLSETVTGDEAKQLLERTLQEQIHQVTLPFTYLLIQALKKTGLQDRIFGLWDRWRGFAAQGLTTLPEMEVNPRSDCHAWSAVPLAEFPATILGVMPAAPGCSIVKIEPHIGQLTWAKGSVATPLGMVEVDWSLEGDSFKLCATVPEGGTAQVKLPDGSEHTLQGKRSFQCHIVQVLK